MSELYTKNLKNALAEIKTQAKQTIREAPTVPATTDTSTAVSKKKTPADKKAAADVKPEAPTACEEVDDTQAKKEISERMRQRLLALTQEHDQKYMIDIADPK